MSSFRTTSGTHVPGHGGETTHNDEQDDIINIPITMPSRRNRDSPIPAQALADLIRNTSALPNHALAAETVRLLRPHSDRQDAPGSRPTCTLALSGTASDPVVSQASLNLVSRLPLPRLESNTANIHSWLAAFESACSRVGVPQADWPASLLFHVSPDLFLWIALLSVPPGVPKADEWRLVHRPAIVNRFDSQQGVLTTDRDASVVKESVADVEMVHVSDNDEDEDMIDATRQVFTSIRSPAREPELVIVDDSSDVEMVESQSDHDGKQPAATAKLAFKSTHRPIRPVLSPRAVTGDHGGNCLEQPLAKRPRDGTFQPATAPPWHSPHPYLAGAARASTHPQSTFLHLCNSGNMEHEPSTLQADPPTISSFLMRGQSVSEGQDARQSHNDHPLSEAHFVEDRAEPVAHSELKQFHSATIGATQPSTPNLSITIPGSHFQTRFHTCPLPTSYSTTISVYPTSTQSAVSSSTAASSNLPNIPATPAYTSRRWRLRILTNRALSTYYGPGVWTFTYDPLADELIEYVSPNDPWSRVVFRAMRAARIDRDGPHAQVWVLDRVNRSHGTAAYERHALSVVNGRYHPFEPDRDVPVRDVVRAFGVDVPPMFTGAGAGGDAHDAARPVAADVFLYIEQMPDTRAGHAWRRMPVLDGSVPVFVKVYDPPRNRRRSRGAFDEVVLDMRVSDFRTVGMTAVLRQSAVSSVFAAIRVLSGAQEAGRETYWLWIEAEVRKDGEGIGMGNRIREDRAWRECEVPWGGVILAREIEG